MSQDVPAINAQVRAYFDSLPTVPPPWERSVDEMRLTTIEHARAFAGEPEGVRSVEQIDANGVPARLYRPNTVNSGAFVWFHGGGFFAGNPDCYDVVTRMIANRAACAVLSVDYRLAPEHPFPAGVDDCWAATLWATERFERVAVGGDSAGGNLAAAVALRARDAGLELALQLLVYPVMNYAPDAHAYVSYRERHESFAGIEGFGAALQDGVQWMWELYVPNPPDRRRPDASPLRASSFEGLPAAFIVTAEHDIFRGEAEDYARELQRAGVPVNHIDFQGQIHGFFAMPGFFDDAHAAINASSAALRDALSAAGAPERGGARRYTALSERLQDSTGT